ncbi:MAG: hypothetical protein PHD82_09815 [Candidatus Riflebacteria bacterium]|jgi:hypothetical protein|nr:hypothetical protein [Candidatus Riflebacteria bacterium]
MANEISTFDLERLAKTFGVRIWFCRRTGRRWSFIAGAGEEKVLPSELIFEKDETGVFVQGEDFDSQRLKAEVERLLNPVAIA